MTLIYVAYCVVLWGCKYAIDDPSVGIVASATKYWRLGVCYEWAYNLNV